VEEADVLLWRPAPSTLFLGGWPTTTMPLYVGTVKAGLLPVGIVWTVRGLLSLSSCSAWKRTELMWMWSMPSRETARDEVFWSLVVLAVALLMRRLLMRVFSAGHRSLFYPWAEAGPLKEPKSRWSGIPRYPEHRQRPRLLDREHRSCPEEGEKGDWRHCRCWRLRVKMQHSICCMIGQDKNISRCARGRGRD
jgi:hypothetical protein